MGLADKAKNMVEDLTDKVKEATGMGTADNREGVSDTDMAPAGPHGVGSSTSTQGNEPSLSGSEASHSSDRLDTGVSSEPNVEPQSPPMGSGDQGG